ncbi:hypothetical protein CYMTET_25122 [Cymbomonas tetramitiformis]|uniref:Uncharacterized protein n=1 Tax=Cymbomonas tetramitiformis TaxID=36881 RepID=A0AAE0FVZ1_9CHLO|nr:hypothetical protein CYMTET_25122 [Cymbomonas tetramitiformis]
MLCYNEKTFLEDQEFRQNLSKFLVASSNIQRFKNTVSIETSLSVILRTSVYMASRMKSVMVGARNKKGMQHIQLKNISTLFWDYLACKMGEVQKVDQYTKRIVVQPPEHGWEAHPTMMTIMNQGGFSGLISKRTTDEQGVRQLVP